MKYRDIFLSVNKPSRYIGGEYNSCDYEKPHGFDFCMCFPEPYELAMSNLGMKILYHMLNEREDTVCERCFFPMQDFSEQLESAGVKLFSIESKKSLTDFDMLGFSIQHELCYTNVLHMLKLAGIPFYSADRCSGPIIIAGGPCSINPEPYAPFFDIIVIGEGEESLNALCSLYIENKGVKKEKFLELAAQIEGVYVPAFSEIKYDLDGTIVDRKDKYGVKKAYVKDFDKCFFPHKTIVPNIEVVHDRGVLELYRGCSNGCRFCQAGFLTRPIRHRSKETLVAQAEEIIKSTGYEEIGLSSLSTGDYPCLRELTALLQPLKENTKFSLPSLRLKGFLKEFSVCDSLTFAPEAGTQRLRDVINKNITDEDIDNAFKEAFADGLKNLKLYFMIGLPTETEADIDGIAEIALRARSLARQAGIKKLSVSVSCAVFIPKPLTPFQWETMADDESVKEKQQLLKQLLIKNNIRFSYHSYEVSRLEGIFARGDRRLAPVIVQAYESGCILDSWSEHFDGEKWKEAFLHCGIDGNFYLKERNCADILPWDFVDAKISRKFLERERDKAYRKETTKDCRSGGCNACGASKEGHCSLC